MTLRDGGRVERCHLNSLLSNPLLPDRPPRSGLSYLGDFVPTILPYHDGTAAPSRNRHFGRLFISLTIFLAFAGLLVWSSEPAEREYSTPEVRQLLARFSPGTPVATLEAALKSAHIRVQGNPAPAGRAKYQSPYRLFLTVPRPADGTTASGFTRVEINIDGTGRIKSTNVRKYDFGL